MITKEQHDELIGKTIKGFKFENDYGNIGYLPEMMDRFIGVEGKIISYYKGNDKGKEYDCFSIDFKTDGYSYPADLVYKQYLSEIKTEDEIYGDIYSLLKSIK
jgi:hypothetical protein